MFFNAALVISAAAMVIYTYGLLSPSTAFAFFSISLCTLSFAAKKTLPEHITQKRRH
jgi:hypothetical protein